MDIRSSLEGLRSILGVGQPAVGVGQPSPSTLPSKTAAGAAATGWNTDRATLSSAASQVSQSAAGSEVRFDKVASIQAQLAAGTYNVPASAVASKVIESMLA